MTESYHADKTFVESAFAEAKVLQQELAKSLHDASIAQSEDEARAALERAEAIKTRLKDKIPQIRERISPFERLLTLKEQYEKQKTLLERVGILVPLKSGQMGIKTIEVPTGARKLIGGKKAEVFEAPFPSYAEINERLKNLNVAEQGESKKFLERKIDQGLTRLRITPFGMPMLSLADIYGKTLVQKVDASVLAYTKQNPFDPNKQPQLIPADQFDRTNPVYRSDDHKASGKGADVAGTIVYFPKFFDQNHGGTTKAELLAKDPSKAWLVSLAEESMNIPRAGGGATIAGRAQIDTSGTSIAEYIAQGQSTPCPSEYLSALQGNNPQNTLYRGERGQTPEEQLTDAILFLEETNQVLDDWQGNGSLNYATGAYFKDSGRVPRFRWLRGDRRADLGWNFPDNRFDNYGVRPVAGESI